MLLPVYYPFIIACQDIQSHRTENHPGQIKPDSASFPFPGEEKSENIIQYPVIDMLTVIHNQDFFCCRTVSNPYLPVFHGNKPIQSIIDDIDKHRGNHRLITEKVYPIKSGEALRSTRYCFSFSEKKPACRIKYKPPKIPFSAAAWYGIKASASYNWLPCAGKKPLIVNRYPVFRDVRQHNSAKN